MEGHISSHDHSHDHSHAHEHGHSHEHDHAHEHDKDDDDAQADVAHFEEVVRSFRFYRLHAMTVHNRMVRDFQAIPETHRNMLSKYPAKLASIRQGVEGNEAFLRRIVADVDLFGRSREDQPSGMTVTVGDADADLWQNVPSADNIDKVHSTLRQFVRDWAVQGRPERAVAYEPLIAEVERRFPLDRTREVNKYRVLVPGCGLARLVWEFAHRGYAVQGNEFSYHMLLASNWVLNVSGQANAASIWPYALASCNRVSLAHQFECIQVPDVDTSNLPAGVDMSMSAGEFCIVYNEAHYAETFDAIVAPFFVDTAHDVIEYLKTFHHLLKPGGVWINFGPLLWHYVEQQEELQIELSLEELLEVTQKMGFTVEHLSRVPASYSSDRNSMMQTLYNCSSFVAVKNPPPKQ